MEIILTQDIDALGEAGQIVRVSPGYARNYLFPKRLARPATPANLKKVEEESRREETRIVRERTRLAKVADILGKVSVTAVVKAGEDDKVFGSVTSQSIADLLAKQGYEFDRRDINLEEPLKALGQYDVEVKLGHGVSGTIKVWVVRE
ncbi:MAG: 50S ribosomal protein L9 [Fidelibacterota bacterium]|nr:MAG: 50S ribosomal protein L9 [Candidatus Neomarinimicrobiota bacterium]